MGMIKIPQAAISKFEKNYPEIFANGTKNWHNSLKRIQGQNTQCPSRQMVQVYWPY